VTTPALRAAAFAAEAAGHPADGSVVVAGSNNTVVWLRPHALIAKVTRTEDGGNLIHEHSVATALAEADAPIAEPLPGVGPIRDAASGLFVTLWQRLEHEPDRRPGPAGVAGTLRAVHDALRSYRGELQSFRDRLVAARELLEDGGRMHALAPGDRGFLREAHDMLTDRLSRRTLCEQPLHGEPHDRNLLITAEGVRWIDFEATCIGPLEWDLTRLPDATVAHFDGVDHDLLELLRLLAGVQTATWCWARYEVPALRWHAEHHLAQVRSGFDGR
jgi:hypothetical protein